VFSVEAVFMIGAIVFCVGGLLGAFISRNMFPPEQQKMLEENLQASRQELDQYQREVAEHFAETAKLVQNLTQSYKNVHDHLSSGALQLTSPEITQQVLAAGDESLGTSTLEGTETQIEAPKDWAPKVPGQEGTLSESYGLKTQTEEEETPKPV
jgi:uncharacterized membrane-anchored protein YhcB (DUF1043 family)